MTTTECRGRLAIRTWYDTFAPGLEQQPIPEEAVVSGPIRPLIPFGVQYRVEMPDGSMFPRHQSGPGATIAVTDGTRIVITQDFRPETGLKIWKCCGGFAGKNKLAAREMVKVFNGFRGGLSELVHQERYSNLHEFLGKLLAREYNGWELQGRLIEFVGRAIGHPNIRICSVMGVVRIEPAELDAWEWPHVANREEAQRFCNTFQFGDVNTDMLVRMLLTRNP